MIQAIRTASIAAMGLLVAVSALAQAPRPDRFLSLSPPEGWPIIPLLEGWIANEDGSRTLVFGFINRNDEPVDVPIGENNYMEPAEFNGMQPTYFGGGARGAQTFTVTLPADRADEDVWWNIKSGTNNELLRVPGRAGNGAYELEFIRPRPQGALQPAVGIGVDGPQQPGVTAAIGDYPGTVRAGEEVTLSVNATDRSIRDTSDPRFEEPLDLNVTWFKHQGPGEVTFIRHPDSPEPKNPFNPEDPRYARWEAADPSVMRILGGRGVANVNVTFSEPGQYMIRTAVDVHTGPDSSQGDQCCSTNVYQRVTVR